MKEYKIAKGWAIFIYITFPLLAAVFLFLLVMPFIPGMEQDFPPSYYWSFSIISLAMITISVLGILDTINGKFVIDKNRVYIISVLSKRELLFHEIKGYRINDKFIFIESTDKNKKIIKISSYFANTAEIKLWLKTNYKDLDKIHKRTEKQEILSNPEFGWSKKEREAKLNLAKKTTTILNCIGSFVGAWTFLFPRPYLYAIIASIVFPIICIIIIKYFKGLIRIDGKNNTVYPSAFWAILAPSMALLIRSLLDFNLYNYSNVWLPMVLITMTYMAILLIGNSEFKYGEIADFFSVFFLMLFILGYSYGIVVSLNCLLDTSKPETFKTTILDKRVSGTKTKTYNLELTPWGKQIEPEEISVSKELYDSFQKNDSATVYFMKGNFDIPWYEVNR